MKIEYFDVHLISYHIDNFTIIISNKLRHIKMFKNILKLQSLKSNIMNKITMITFMICFLNSGGIFDST